MRLALEAVALKQKWKSACRTVAREAILALLGAGLLSLGAKVRFVMPFTAVPFTLQTFFLTLLVLAYGRRAVAAVASYLALGLAGAPVFAYGGGLWYLLSPTFGYLIGFLAASLYGFAFGKKLGSPLRMILLVLLINSTVYAFGWLWLAVQHFLSGLSLQASLTASFVQGVLPFFFWDLLKGYAALYVFIRYMRARSGIQRRLSRFMKSLRGSQLEV